MIERHFLEHFKGRTLTAIGMASETRLCMKFDSGEVLIIEAGTRKSVRPGALGKPLAGMRFVAVKADGNKITTEETRLEEIRGKMKKRANARSPRTSPEAPR